MKDWKQIASGLRLTLPEEDLDRLVPSLEKVDADFRLLVSGIPLETEPAYVLFRKPERSEQ